MKPQALHVRIAADVERRIMSGAWKPGARIPYEHELMQSWGCSRMTVNKALRSLQQAGLLERRRRAGTFVAAPHFQRAVLEIPDIRREIEAQGRGYGLETGATDIRVATDADRARMPVPHGTELLFVHSRHLAGGLPYAVEDRLINLVAVPEARDVDFTAEPPGSWLLGHVPWSAAEHRITAINADAAMARALDVDTGAACLVLERWTWREGQHITYARQTSPGDRHALVARFGG